jgi:hypothetical protein
MVVWTHQVVNFAIRWLPYLNPALDALGVA